MAIVSNENLVRAIHGQAMRFVLATTGGGSEAISGLLSVPGASRSILSATVPYALSALAEWLGCQPEEACSPGTARAMAMSGFLKAGVYDTQAQVCGVGCTASLATDRAKRGSHRVHLACQTAEATAALSIELEKGRRTRAEEEAIVAAIILNSMAQACGVGERVALALTDREHVQSRRIVAPEDQQDLLAGRALAAIAGARRKSPPLAIFPGAFHPLHDGHRSMAEAAARILKTDVSFEISIENVDKPPLDFLEIDHRVRQFAPTDQIWLTRAPTFVQKASLFPQATFIVGADTIHRIGQERYYGGQAAVRDRAIAVIAAAGCRFLVFGRNVDGTFCTLANLKIPKSLSAIAQEVPAEEFRHDISSTALRGAQRTSAD